MIEKKYLMLTTVITLLMTSILFIRCNEKPMYLDCDEYNQEITKARSAKKEWANHLDSIVAKLFLNKTKNGQVTRDSDVNSDKQIWTIIRSLNDDSVAEEKLIITFIKQNNDWFIFLIETKWVCVSGRGHKDFSTETCN